MADKRFRTFPIGNQFLYGNNLQAMRFRKFQKLRRSHHVAVVRHDFTAEPRRIQSRQLRQIDGGLRMPRPPKHAARHCPKRKHMTGAPETRRLRRRIDQKPHRLGALKGGNSRIRRNGVHGNGKGRFMIVRIVCHHRRDIESVETLPLHRRANQSFRICRHEIYGLRRHLVRRDNQVSFVFPVFVVDHHQHFPLLYILNGVLNSGETHFSASSSKSAFCQKLHRQAPG